MKQYQQACVGAFIQKADTSFLVVKRAEDDEFLPGLWELPGGGTDFGEELQQTVMREIKEETGLEISVLKPIAVHTHYMDKKDERIQRVEVTFLCQLTGEDTVQLSHEHAAYKWVLPSDLHSLKLTPYMDSVIQDSLKNSGYR